MKKKIEGVLIFFFLFFSGCALFCRIPEAVKKSEFLQARQAERINVFLKEIVKNPEILVNPRYKDLIEAILEASDALKKSTKRQSEYLGLPEEEK